MGKKKKEVFQSSFKRSDEKVPKKSPLKVKEHVNGYASTSDLSDSDAGAKNLRLRNSFLENHASGRSGQKRKDDSLETEKSRKETKIWDKINSLKGDLSHRRPIEDQVKTTKDRSSSTAELTKRKDMEDEKSKEEKSPKRPVNVKRGKPMPDSMKETVADSTAESAVDSPSVARSESSLATSGDTSDHMPELEPQVIVPPKLAAEKPQAMIAKGRMENGHRESQSASKYEKSGKKKAKEETKQMSIREFLMKKKKVSVPVGDASLSSASSQEDEILVKKQKSEKLKELSDVKGNGVVVKEKQVLGTTEAIEKKFDSNVGYLTAFESFMGDKNDKQSMKGGKEMSLLSKPCNVKVKKCSSNPDVQNNSDKKEGKGPSYTLLNSTMHPKRVLKKEKEKERERERSKKNEEKELERKREEAQKREDEARKKKELEEKRQLEKEREELKRREEKKRLERQKEETKRKEKEEKRRLEKEERLRQEKEEKERIEKERDEARKQEEQLRADEKKRREKEEKKKQAQLAEKSKVKSPRKDDTKSKEERKRGEKEVGKRRKVKTRERRKRKD